jgi:hypothetical protein
MAMTTAERQAELLPHVQECDRIAGELARLFDAIAVAPWHAMTWGMEGKSALNDVQRAKDHVESCCELLKRVVLAK